jgi:hypothetical protein
MTPTQLDFLTLIWFFPVALALHELEEWNIINWYHNNFVDLPDKTQISTRFFLVFVSLLGFVWTGIAVLCGDATIAAYILFSLVAIVFLNCLQHIYWQFLFKAYAPGILSTVFLLLPVIGILVYRALAENLIPIWYVLLLFIVIVPGFVDTLRAGNTLTPQFLRIHRFSKNMVRWLRLE